MPLVSKTRMQRWVEYYFIGAMSKMTEWELETAASRFRHLATEFERELQRQQEARRGPSN